MTNEESYKMMEAMRRYLRLKVYETDKSTEVVLLFCTEDGRVHQLCNSHMEKQK
jgi:hypothetical protein